MHQIQANQMKKGDVLATARIAAIQAAKKTHEIIPLCHAICLTGIKINFEFIDAGIKITACCRAKDATGVEMEALTAASVCALTIYDMSKAIDRGMCIGNLMLMKKQGGKSGDWQRKDDQTVS